MSGEPDRWLLVTVRTPAAMPNDRVADVLTGLGSRAVEERDDALLTYFEPPYDPEALVRELRDRLESLPGADSVDVAWRWQPHEEWERLWKEGLEPRRVGSRIVVTPSWIDPETGPADIVIRLDPGVGFGTAGHATTRGCLRLLEPTVSGGDRVADLGTGSGILAIAAVRLGAREVVALDSDPLACGAARENAAVNGVADRVRVVVERATRNRVAGLAPLDGLISNIEGGVIVRLLPGIARALRPGGWVILGGILLHEREGVLETASGLGLVLEGEDREEEWWAARFRTSSAPDAG